MYVERRRERQRQRKGEKERGRVHITRGFCVVVRYYYVMSMRKFRKCRVSSANCLGGCASPLRDGASQIVIICSVVILSTVGMSLALYR